VILHKALVVILVVKDQQVVSEILLKDLKVLQVHQLRVHKGLQVILTKDRKVLPVTKDLQVRKVH